MTDLCLNVSQCLQRCTTGLVVTYVLIVSEQATLSRVHMKELFMHACVRHASVMQHKFSRVSC